MTGKIRLGCQYCDRSDFDGIEKLPTDWDDVAEVSSFEEACKPVVLEEKIRSVFDWQTHLGTCPECRTLYQ